MSRDRRGNGVQVVGGSNPPCPTKHTPNARGRGVGDITSARGERSAFRVGWREGQA